MPDADKLLHSSWVTNMSGAAISFAALIHASPFTSLRCFDTANERRCCSCRNTLAKPSDAVAVLWETSPAQRRLNVQGYAVPSPTENQPEQLSQLHLKASTMRRPQPNHPSATAPFCPKTSTWKRWATLRNPDGLRLSQLPQLHTMKSHQDAPAMIACGAGQAGGTTSLQQLDCQGVRHCREITGSGH
jgi:hypothetical protein